MKQAKIQRYRGFNIRGQRGEWWVEGRACYRTLALAKAAIRDWLAREAAV